MASQAAVDNHFTRQHMRDSRVRQARERLGLASSDLVRLRAEELLCDLVERLQQRGTVYVTKKLRNDGTFELVLQ